METTNATATEAPCQCKFCFWATLGPDVCDECLAEFAAEVAAAAYANGDDLTTEVR